jgi:hypothetical protein
MKDEVLEERSPEQQPPEERLPEQKQRITKYLYRSFINCRGILISPYTQAVLGFSCLIMIVLCLVSMYCLYAKLND